MPNRYPVAAPRPGTNIREFVNFVRCTMTNNRCDLWPMVDKFGPKVVSRMLLTLDQDYRWFNCKASGFWIQEFGKWAEYQIDPNQCSAFEDGRKFFTDPRWKPSPGGRVDVTRTTIFRGEPPKGSKIGTTWRFLVNNKAPVTGEVNVQYLYAMFGSKMVSKHFHLLRQHYGFEIEAMGKRGWFVVKRLTNRKIKRLLSPSSQPGFVPADDMDAPYRP